MGGARPFAVAAALGLLLVLLHGCPPPGAAARPLARGGTSSEEEEESWSTLLLAPSASDDERGLQWRADADAAARAGKWLPFAGSAHGMYPAGALGVPGGVKAAATRQDHAAMWASLLNPTQARPTPAWALPGNGEAPPATGGIMFGGQPTWP